MKKLKVCRKLVAFILTLCMVLPLISNQYFVVHAEEASENGEISYQDVPALDLGENSIQTDVQTVRYLSGW
mgnify:CR=1 FL=1